MSGRPLNVRRTSSYLTAPRTPYSYGGSSGSSLNSLVDDYSYGWSEPSARLFSRQSTPQPEERSNSGLNAPVPTTRRRSSSSVSSIRTAASDTAADDATPPRMLEFAKQKNPTLSVRLSRRLTWECTYAELLQYASALLSARRLARLWWPPASRWQSQMTLSVGSSEEAAATASMPIALLVANASILLIALATLDMRRNGEKLGLRRTWLVLCAALFITSCLVAVWPAASSSSSSSSKGGLSAKAASDMAKHSIDDIERIVAARIATWRGSPHAATPNTARFELPNWPTDTAADTATDAIIRRAQICTLAVHEQPWQQYKCHDVDDKVHEAARGMLSKEDGSDQVARLCAQLPDGQASMLRMQLRNRHTVMIMCNEHK